VSILEFVDLIYLSDLKLGNILMSFENEHILTDFIERPQPMQFKVDNESGRTIYRCHNDFGALDGREIKNMVPKIADFGLATRLDRPSTRIGMVAEQLGIYPIQPDYYRAPEVILGCGWDFKADIWNFGVLVRPCTCFQNVNLQHNALFLPLAWD
jgi:serine/threonine protein kinase